MPSLSDMELVQASVPRTATFREAAEALDASGLAAIAVLDEQGRPVGLFTADDLLRGVFPRYLGELRHTAFMPEDATALAAHVEKAGSDSVTEHMQPPQTVRIDTSKIHVAERFLHVEAGALAVVEDGRFRGMIDQVSFARAVLSRT